MFESRAPFRLEKTQKGLVCNNCGQSQLPLQNFCRKARKKLAQQLIRFFSLFFNYFPVGVQFAQVVQIVFFLHCAFNVGAACFADVSECYHSVTTDKKNVSDTCARLNVWHSAVFCLLDFWTCITTEKKGLDGLSKPFKAKNYPLGISPIRFS